MDKALIWACGDVIETDDHEVDERHRRFSLATPLLVDELEHVKTDSDDHLQACAGNTAVFTTCFNVLNALSGNSLFFSYRLFYLFCFVMLLSCYMKSVNKFSVFLFF